MRDTDGEIEVETQAEGEVGAMQGARCGTRSQVSSITSWAEGGAKPLSHWGCPRYSFRNKDSTKPFLFNSFRGKEVGL